MGSVLGVLQDDGGERDVGREGKGIGWDEKKREGKGKLG
jgi:hypothetical protein